MKKISPVYAFVSFFKTFPPKYAVGDIAYNFFNYWPSKNKKLFYFSNFKIKKKNFLSVKIFNNSISKLINLPFLFIQVFNFLSPHKKKYIIIEGASYIGFSFIFIILSKIFLKNLKIIYHSHNIEYEVRKYKSNFIMQLITFFLEKYVFNNSSYSTTTSVREKKIIKKYYNCNCYVLKNGIVERKIAVGKKYFKKIKYIYFNGSYKYWPNKYAIDKIISKYQIFLKKNFPYIKIIIFSEFMPPNYQKIDNVIPIKNYINNKKYLNVIKNALFLCAPLPKAPGTKIKIIEALYYGIPIFSSKDAFVGIKTKKLNKSFIILKKNTELKQLKECIKNQKILKKHANLNIHKVKDTYNYNNLIKKFFAHVNK